MHRKLLIAGMALLLSACTASTNFVAEQPNLRLRINKDPAFDVSQAGPRTYKTTSFGQYFFEVSDNDNQSMYGLLPLRFNGGYLALDIVFFDPGIFYDLRQVFRYYDFDVKKGVVRYKDKGKSWVTYTPTPAEEEHAKRYFNVVGGSKDAGPPAKAGANQ